jgi:glutathione S-transferase
MLVLYHAGRTQASVKVRLTLREKGLSYESRYLSIVAQDHLTPEYLAINPDAQVPTLIHDGTVITETTVINEYLDDAFLDPPLRPARAHERARMRRWGQIVDEHLFHAMATLGWHFGVGPLLRARDPREIERSLMRLRLPSKRQKWLKATRSGFSDDEINEARGTISYGIALMEQALAKSAYLAGETYTLADINVYSSVQRMPRWAPDLMNEQASPRTFDWLERLQQRPAVKAMLADLTEAPPLEPDAMDIAGPAGSERPVWAHGNGGRSAMS